MVAAEYDRAAMQLTNQKYVLPKCDHLSDLNASC
jgi:hypothetical protein